MASDLSSMDVDRFIRRNYAGIKFPVLPTEYDDALSYYEGIQKVYMAVKEALKYIYDFSEDVIQEANDYTDEQIAALRAALTAQIGDVDSKYEKLYGDIVISMGQLTVKVNQLYQAWDQYHGYLDGRLTAMMAQLKQYIDSLLIDRIVYVINPITGVMDSLQNTLNMMWQKSNSGGLTAAEYDSFQLTATIYDQQSITAEEYDVRGRWLLFFFRRIYLSMRSPFTGRMDLYENVINALADLHKNALTAVEYDAMNIVAQGYDAGQYTAYEYDWNGKALVH